MNQRNKAKLYLILSVMINFTILNIMRDSDWVGYLCSLIIQPLLTWGVIELLMKYE